MDIFIYFELNEDIDIDYLEESIDEVLGDEGEVTGRGMGVSGGNLDIELFKETILEDFLKKLRELEFPQDTYYVINGEKTNLF